MKTIPFNSVIVCIVLFAVNVTSSLLPAAETTSQQYEKIHSLLRDASSGRNTDVTYIISGDSTRMNSFNFMIPYYESLFAKIKVKVVNDASSGLDAKDWNANKRKKACLAHAIASTAGKGENTILEYSFGINDQGRGASRKEQKRRYKEGIQAYLKAKPLASVILVVPVAHGGKASNLELYDIYRELAEELSLPLVDGLKATVDVYGNSKYYNDGTHPNQWGSRRLLHYILTNILPPDLYSVVTLEEAVNVKASDASELFHGVEKGYCSDSLSRLGAPGKAPNSWRIREIAVEPNFILKIKTGAKRNEVFFMDETGACVLKRYLGPLGRRKYVSVVVPPTGVALRMTLCITDPHYDPTKDTISIRYDVNNANYMSIKDINKGLPIALKVL